MHNSFKFISIIANFVKYSKDRSYIWRPAPPPDHRRHLRCASASVRIRCLPSIPSRRFFVVGVHKCVRIGVARRRRLFFTVLRNLLDFTSLFVCHAYKHAHIYGMQPGMNTYHTTACDCHHRSLNRWNVCDDVVHTVQSRCRRPSTISNDPIDDTYSSHRRAARIWQSSPHDTLYHFL